MESLNTKKMHVFMGLSITIHPCDPLGWGTQGKKKPSHSNIVGPVHRAKGQRVLAVPQKGVHRKSQASLLEPKHY